MKIKTKHLSYDQVAALKKTAHKKPMKPNILLHTLVRVLSIPELCKTKFTYTTKNMEKAGDGPCLILMNHSSFIDLKIAFKMLYPKPFSIVCTTDALVGKALLLRFLGCIPTHKFVSDSILLEDMRHALTKNKTSILMYPEAGYSFDGCATALPQKFGLLLKMLDVPVVGIRTYGAFSYDPLYNGLQKRKVKINAEMECLLSREEVREKSVSELDEVLAELFRFDSFAWQKENNIEIHEPFRADGLHRILYRCIHCGSEGVLEGKGTTLTCSHCGKIFELTPLGQLVSEGETYHIPDWYNWQRTMIRDEIAAGDYRMELDVDIGMLVNHKCLYMVGEGKLTHTKDGFELIGCDGKLQYTQKPMASHSLNSDYFWYEIGDVIGIGTREALYYCFPKQKDVVTKARLAAEEIYASKRRRVPKQAAKTDAPEMETV